MTIIKHGRILFFTCPECGCEWKASRSECRTEKIRVDNIPCGTRIVCDCPDCGKTTQPITK